MAWSVVAGTFCQNIDYTQDAGKLVALFKGMAYIKATPLKAAVKPIGLQPAGRRA